MGKVFAILVLATQGAREIGSKSRTLGVGV